MRVLITGGSGFIGTNLVDRFHSLGHKVLNLDIAPPRNIAHSKLWKRCNLLDLEMFRAVVKEFMPDVIFHMAARTDLEGNSLVDYSVNTEGVKNLITILQDSDYVSRVIFASSRLVCKIGYIPKDEFDYCPTTFYGESKIIGEQLARDFASKSRIITTIVRPTSIWGPWFSVPYKDFFLSVAKGKYFHPGKLQILKSFGFVGNTIYQLESLLGKEDAIVSAKTFYLADYQPIDVKEMANSIRDNLGLSNVYSVNIFILRLLAKVGDGLKFMGLSNPPLTSFRLNNLITQMTYDLNPLKAVVGTLPYTMQDGVSLTLSWLESQGEL